MGGDINKFWWKNEGEAVFHGPDEGETETDLLSSRLITPFWNFKLGGQYGKGSVNHVIPASTPRSPESYVPG